MITQLGGSAGGLSVLEVVAVPQGEDKAVAVLEEAKWHRGGGSNQVAQAGIQYTHGWWTLFSVPEMGAEAKVAVVVPAVEPIVRPAEQE